MRRFFTPARVISIIETARPSDRWMLRILLIGLILATTWFALTVNTVVSKPDISNGGTVTEGIVGTPRFVNPVLALTRADQDVSEIIYSGLLQQQRDGGLAPDLAAGWTVSPDGTTYTVTLREDIQFHDGIPVTATDVMYTVSLIQNENLKSPLRSNWTGVTAEMIDDRTIEFVLSEPYAPFLYNLTTGVLPAHIWRSIPIEQVPFSSYNTTPIGSGPYQIADTTFGRNGTVERYELERFAEHTPSGLLETITLSFFDDEDQLEEAFMTGDIDATAYLSAKTVASLENDDSITIKEAPLTRTFALFFNQNKSELLRDAAVREALDLLLDRENLVNNALAGAGVPTNSIVTGLSSTVESGNVHGDDTDLDTNAIVTEILEAAGWIRNGTSGQWELVDGNDRTSLTVTIKTANTPLFQDVATNIKEQWEDFGITVTTEQYEQTDLLQSIIRERDFTILLFGIDPGVAGDIFPFWHSSQQNDPGLNIAQYANVTVDESLETLRTTKDAEDQAAARSTIKTIITEERPALFLFQPTVQYVSQTSATPVLPDALSRPADRFVEVTSWYANARDVWPIFSEDTEADFNTDE